MISECTSRNRDHNSNDRNVQILCNRLFQSNRCKQCQINQKRHDHLYIADNKNLCIHNKYIDKIQKKRKRVQQKNNDNATNGKYILHFIFLLIICIFLKYF